MKKLKNKFILLLLIVVVSFAVNFMGCSKNDESLKVLNEYYNNIKSNNFDSSYEYLSSASKNIWTKEKYKEWESISMEVLQFKEVKIKKSNESKDKELDGIKYEDVVEYSTTETHHDNYNNKDINSDYTIYIVKENGEWKICRKKEDPKENIAVVKAELAVMYVNGKGKNKDLGQAEDILEKSIEENPDYSSSYYLLGLIYDEVQRYDDAINCEQQCVDKSKNEKDKSNGYCVLGETYENKKGSSSAKEYYEKALEANPDNQDAKEKLAKLNLKSQ